MRPEDIEEKFRTNAGVVLDAGRIEKILSAVRGIEGNDSMRDLIALCIK